MEGAKPTSVVGVAAATNSVGEGPTIDFSSIWAQNSVYHQDAWNEGWTIGRIGAVYDNQVGNGGALVFYTHSGTTASGGANNAEVSEKMRISPNGNVGIGTTTPQKKFHIEHTAGASEGILISGASDTAGHTAGILLRAEGGEADSALRAKAGIFLERTGTYGIGKLHIALRQNSDNVSATISDAQITVYDNKVGIGTTNPAQNFVVAAATNGIGIELVPGALNYIQAYNRGTSDYSDLKIDAQTIRFGLDNGAERVRIDSTGDVLIGTDTNLNVLSGTPKLQIGSGTGHASLQFYSGATSVNGIYFGDTSSANNDRYDGYIEYRHNDGSMAFRANGDSVLTLDPNGLMQGSLSRYTNSSNINTIMDDTDEKAASIGSSWTTLTYWIASQSGELRTTLGLYISSGSYYYNYRFFNVTKNTVVKMSNNSTDASHFYNANRTSYIGNVHQYSFYQLDLGVVDAGDEIQIQMQAATGTGVAAAGNGQIGYVKQWRFLSGKQVPVERDNGVMERPTVRGVMRQSQLQNGTGPVTHTIPVFLGSGTHNIFSILTGFDQGSMAVASIRYVALYAYAANNSGLGDQQATIRRGTSNTQWSVGNKTVHFETNGGGVSTPAFAWTTGGVLQMIIAGSVQVVGEVTITTYAIPGYKYGINV